MNTLLNPIIFSVTILIVSSILSNTDSEQFETTSDQQEQQLNLTEETTEDGIPRLVVFI